MVALLHECGALVLMGGHAFAARPISDAFAVVSTDGVADVPVRAVAPCFGAACAERAAAEHDASLNQPQPGEQAPLADANVKVVSGFLESSNVNAVEEMTAILSLSRQFELHVKMMRTAEDDSAAMARVLQIS